MKSNDEKKIPYFVMILKMSFFLCLFISCADLTKVSTDPLAKDQRYYRLRTDKPLIIYHRKCKKVGTGLTGKFDCTETEYDLKKDWDYFAPSFMFAPYHILK